MELIVGHRRVRTAGNVPESIYIRRVGEAQSWLAEGRLPVDADPQLWFEREISNIRREQVASVVSTRAEGTLEFGRDGEAMVLKSPAEHPNPKPPEQRYGQHCQEENLQALNLFRVHCSREPWP